MSERRPPHEQESETRRWSDEMQGEGDRASARRYSEHVREFVESDQAERAAREAREAVEGPEGPSLREAEEEGKEAARLTPGERARATLNRVRNGVARALTSLADRVAVPHHHSGHGSGS